MVSLGVSQLAIRRDCSNVIVFCSSVVTALSYLSSNFKSFLSSHQSSGFGIEPELTIKLAKQKLRFFEVPISYNGRSYAEGKKIGLSDAFKAIYCIVKYKLF